MTKFKEVKNIFDKNKESIYEYNQEMIPRSLIIAMIGLLIPIFFAIFRESMRETIFAYLITFAIILSIYIGFKLRIFKDNIIIFAYALGIVLFLFVLYLSVVRFPTRPAGIALSFFIVAPLIIVDRSTRVNIVLFSMYLIHAILSFHIKSSYLAATDFLNTLISLILGMLFGRMFLISRLKIFEMKRLLIIEKDTDYLTNLANRRKFYSDFEKIAMNNKADIGLLMIDIDSFKEYNDLYGHVNGDLLLYKFARLLKKYEEEYKVSFYRFGGEEFVGIASNYTEKELTDLAEVIRIESSKLEDIEGNITASIGLSICKNTMDDDISELLDQADKALYRAKKDGRNRIVSNFNK